MNIKLNKEKISTIINKYYREVYEIEGKTKILGEETPISIDISDNDLKTIIKYYLEQDGYSVTNIMIDKGLDYKTEGYGLGEHTESYPYFRGVEINIYGKEKKIGERK